MKCGQAKELMIDLIYGELPAERSSQAKEHIASCPECAREYEELKATLAALRNLPDPKLPPFINTRVQAHVQEAAMKHRSWWAWMMKPGLAAAAVVVIVASVAIIISRGDYRTLKPEAAPVKMETSRPEPKPEKAPASAGKGLQHERKELEEEAPAEDKTATREGEAEASVGGVHRALAEDAVEPTDKEVLAARPPAPEPSASTGIEMKEVVWEKASAAKTLTAMDLVIQAGELEGKGQYASALKLYENALTSMGYGRQVWGKKPEVKKEEKAPRPARTRTFKALARDKKASPCSPELKKAVFGALRCYKKLDRKADARGLESWYQSLCQDQQGP